MREVHEKSVSGVGELLSLLKGLPGRKRFWFRGHEDASWKLIPSIFREPFNIGHEPILNARFQQNAPPFLPQDPKNEWEWLFLMQHYSLPTRLLDWSESPLVALYFCVEDLSKDSVPGTFWVLDPAEKNKTIAHYQPKQPIQIPFLASHVDNLLVNYSPTKLTQESSTSLPPMSAIAVRFSNRMQAQHGSFTIFHRNDTPLDAYPSARQFLSEIRVLPKDKPEIRRELNLLGIHRMSIFPDLDSVAALAKELI